MTTIAAALAAASLCSARAAQDGDSQPPVQVRPDQPISTTPAPPSTSTGPSLAGDSASDPTAIFRAPLIREGSGITDVTAHIQRDADRNWWKLIIDQTDAKLAQQELFLLPCTQLSQMQHIVEATPGRAVQFQVSGRVFVFRGRNYMLPTYAPVLPQSESRPPDGLSSNSNDASSAGDAANAISPAEQLSGDGSSDDPVTPPRAPERAADIMRDLERAADPLPRPASATTGANGAGARAGGGSSRSTASPSSDGTVGGKLLPEETQIVNRRGKITRDSGGGWLFVFDADASGLADPPMRLLPCLLLERIEDYARRTGNNSPALISGPAYLYDGRNYLLPTVFRIPAERKNITP